MTKIEAIKRVLIDNDNFATLETIYEQIVRHYPNAKKSRSWQEGIRGVLYREINDNGTIEKISTGYYHLLRAK